MNIKFFYLFMHLMSENLSTNTKSQFYTTAVFLNQITFFIQVINKWK